MALIACPECSREISDKVKQCPHCGYPLVEENDDTQKVEVTSVNLKLQESNKKRLLTIITCLALVALIAFGIHTLYSSQRSADYRKNIDIVLKEMLSSGAEAEDLMNLTAKVWYNTIYEKRDSETDIYTRKNGYWESDFNTSLAYLYTDSDTEITIDSIKLSQASVKSIMKKLQNPPKEYEKAYDTLSELYSTYQRITALAISPEGSLSSFNNNRSEKTSEFMELFRRIETQLPEKTDR